MNQHYIIKYLQDIVYSYKMEPFIIPVTLFHFEKFDFSSSTNGTIKNYLKIIFLLSIKYIEEDVMGLDYANEILGLNISFIKKKELEIFKNLNYNMSVSILNIKQVLKQLYNNPFIRTDYQKLFKEFINSPISDKTEGTFVRGVWIETL